MSDVECPYCGHEQEVCQDDGHACEDGAIYGEQCYKCEKYFALTPCISYSFSGEKADCMNGGDHNWAYGCHALQKKVRRVCLDCHKSEWVCESEKLKLMGQANA